MREAWVGRRIKWPPRIFQAFLGKLTWELEIRFGKGERPFRV
jgi:hypothetical protein